MMLRIICSCELLSFNHSQQRGAYLFLLQLTLTFEKTLNGRKEYKIRQRKKYCRRLQFRMFLTSTNDQTLLNGTIFGRGYQSMKEGHFVLILLNNIYNLHVAMWFDWTYRAICCLNSTEIHQLLQRVFRNMFWHFRLRCSDMTADLW